MDQIQQNFNSPTNPKNNWGYFWWGFSDLGRKQQNQARKHGVGARKTWSTWLWYQDDVERNPMGSIFHVRSGSYEETRRTRERTQGKSRGKMRETLNQQVIDHTRARSPKAQSITRSKVNKGRYKSNRSSPWGGLDCLFRMEALNPNGSSLKRRDPSRGVDPVRMSNALSQWAIAC